MARPAATLRGVGLGADGRKDWRDVCTNLPAQYSACIIASRSEATSWPRPLRAIPLICWVPTWRSRYPRRLCWTGPAAKQAVTGVGEKFAGHPALVSGKTAVSLDAQEGRLQLQVRPHQVDALPLDIAPAFSIHGLPAAPTHCFIMERVGGMRVAKVESQE